MSPEELMQTARLAEAMEALKAQVRDAPGDATRRFFLFQLLAVEGQWERALNQLNVAAELDANMAIFAHAGRRLLQAEAFREQVMSGGRSPMILGEPGSWIVELVRSLSHLAGGDWDAAQRDRESALDAAPLSPGRVDDRDVEFLADADARFGPVFEGVVDGAYYWIPMSNVASIELEAPSRLRDLLWLPATFVWKNEGVSPGFLFARYPGTHRAEDDLLRLGRATQWKELGGGIEVGIGQRVLISDGDDIPLLGCRQFTFEHATAESADSAGTGDA